MPTTIIKQKRRLIKNVSAVVAVRARLGSPRETPCPAIWIFSTRRSRSFAGRFRELQSVCPFVTAQRSRERACVNVQKYAYARYLYFLSLFLFCVCVRLSSEDGLVGGGGTKKRNREEETIWEKGGFVFVRFSFCARRLFASLTVNGSAHSCVRDGCEIFWTRRLGNFIYCFTARAVADAPTSLIHPGRGNDKNIRRWPAVECIFTRPFSVWFVFLISPRRRYIIRPTNDVAASPLSVLIAL